MTQPTVQCLQPASAGRSSNLTVVKCSNDFITRTDCKPMGLQNHVLDGVCWSCALEAGSYGPEFGCPCSEDQTGGELHVTINECTGSVSSGPPTWPFPAAMWFAFLFSSMEIASHGNSKIHWEQRASPCLHLHSPLYGFCIMSFRLDG